MIEREAFQEIDYRRMFGPLAKWVAQIDERRADPRARLARVPGRDLADGPGRSCSRCPRTCSSSEADVADARPTRRSQAAPAAADSSSVRDAARAARAPARGRRRPPWSARGARGAARPGARRAASRSPRRGAARTTSTTTSPRYAGHVGLGADPRLAERVRDADVLLVIGARLGEIETGGLHAARRARAAAGADPRPSRPGRARAGVRAGARDHRRHAAFAEALARARAARRGPRGPSSTLARADVPRRPRAPRACPGDGRHGRGDGRLRRAPAAPTRSSRAVRATSPSGRTASTSSGGTARSSRRRAARWDTGFPPRSPRSSSHPERDVVCLAGDGDFLMTGAGARDRACRTSCAVVVLVVDNGMYGTIRMHQERRYPGRVCGTDLVESRLRALARAFGALRGARRADRGRPRGARARARRGTAGGAPAAGRPRGADAAADALGDPGRGGRLKRARRARRPAETLEAARRHPGHRRLRATQSNRGGADGEVVCEHRARRVRGRRLGSDPGLQRPRHVARRDGRDQRDRGREGRRPGRRDPQLHAHATGRTSASSFSRTRTSSARTPTTSRRRRSTSTTTQSTIRVTPVTDGGTSFVEWWTTFDCDRDKQAHWVEFFANAVFQGGLDALKAHFAG